MCLQLSHGRVPPSVGKRSRRERQRQRVISPSVLFHEPKLCLLIRLFFSQQTPLMACAYNGNVETCRLLVASKADVAAKHRCRSPWRARNLPLTPCVAAATTLPPFAPGKTAIPTLLHTLTVSARRDEPRPANRKRPVHPPRVTVAACRYALGLRPLGPDDIVTTGGTGSEMRRVALMWPSLAATTTSRDQVRRHPARGRQPRILSLHLKE